MPVRYCLILLFFLVPACATLPRSVEPEIGYREEGIASWYGGEFHGRPTASGEIYDMNLLTAAHRTLPLGTVLRVTELKTGRSIQVKVNDRGPFISGRTLDLSYGAASRLGMIGPGTARVALEVISLPGSALRTAYTVQVGAFAVEENAIRLKQELVARYQPVMIQPFETNRQLFYRVRVGSYPTQMQAERAARRLAFDEEFETFVTRRDP